MIINGKNGKELSSELTKLIEAQAFLSAAVLAAGERNTKRDKVYAQLSQVWKSSGDKPAKYVETLTGMEASSGVIVLGGFLMEHLVAEKSEQLGEKLKV